MRPPAHPQVGPNPPLAARLHRWVEPRGASKLLVEARFAAALTARGYATTPAAAHELQLCLPSHVAGTARAAEAIAALTKVGLVCRKL